MCVLFENCHLQFEHCSVSASQCTCKRKSTLFNNENPMTFIYTTEKINMSSTWNAYMRFFLLLLNKKCVSCLALFVFIDLDNVHRTKKKKNTKISINLLSVGTHFLPTKNVYIYGTHSCRRDDDILFIYIHIISYRYSKKVQYYNII